jgi:4-aminobutyrate aminotransferase-like enzyme
MKEQHLMDEQKRLLFPCVSPFYAEPVVMEKGQGVWVTDVNGKEYLDLFAGVLTTSVGHCHPEVVERVHEQSSRLGHTSTLYVTEQQIDVARKLEAISPGALQSSFFTNSGTEAVETAIMLARIHTGRHDIICLRHGYSGRSALSSELTAHASWRQLPSTVTGLKPAAAPYTYRSPLGDATLQEHEDYFIRDLEEVIETTTNGKPAAFFAETILGVGGYIVPPPGYFKRAAELIRSCGGLFISDEVQAGFGRTGQHWFGISHWDVDPDIMVMAKGFANGFPAAATIAKPDIAASWTSKTFSTFGGNPVAMAAASATLDVMQREDVCTNADERGGELGNALDKLAERYAWIGEARGMGLMRGIEIITDPDTKNPDPVRAKAVLKAAKEEGLLLGLGGLHGQVMRIGPSLLITQDEIAEGTARLTRACVKADGAI